MTELISPNSTFENLLESREESILTVNSEELNPAESETIQAKAKRQKSIYKHLCSVRNYDTAKKYLYGKMCSEQCNQNCLFCKSHHKYKLQNQTKSLKGTKYWYCCKSKSCNSKIQIMPEDQHFYILIANESTKHDPITKTRSQNSSVDTVIQQKIIDLDNLGRKPTEILAQLKEDGFNEISRPKITKFVEDLHKKKQSNLGEKKMGEAVKKALNAAAYMSIAIQVIRNLKRKADIDLFVPGDECKRARI